MPSASDGQKETKSAPTFIPSELVLDILVVTVLLVLGAWLSGVGGLVLVIFAMVGGAFVYSRRGVKWGS